MDEDGGRRGVAGLPDSIMLLVPALVKRLEVGIEVLDVGCGSGGALNLLARTFPNSRFVGYDLWKEGIARGRAEAEEYGSANIRFEVRDASALGVRARYDLIIALDAAYGETRPEAVLRGIADALRPDGVYLMRHIAVSGRVHQTLDYHAGASVHKGSCVHCMTVSLARGGAQPGAMFSEQRALDALERSGFTGVKVRRLPHDSHSRYFIASRGRKE